MLEIRHQAIYEGLSTQDAYDQFYQERDLLLRDSFYLWLLELLAPKPGARLLDISCGNGRLVQLAVQQGINAIGLDFAMEGFPRNSADFRQADWIVSDGEQIPIDDNDLSYITHIGSLEHYNMPLFGAQEIARILKPQGRACILLPNAFGLLGNIRYVQRTGEIFDDGQPLQRYATRRTWETLLEQAGLQIEQLIPFGEVNFPRTRADLLWTLVRPQKMVRALLIACTPTNLANHFVFICRKAENVRATTYYPMLPSP